VVAEVPFDLVITAEQVRSYKPALAHFKTMLARTGLPIDQHLHAAASLFHDIAPANSLGLPNVLVQRRRGQRSAHASQNAGCEPHSTVRDLAELAALLLEVE
jgi:2-haloacid dehalogenase